MLPHQASIHWNARNWYPKRNGCTQTREEGLYCRNCAYMRWFSSGFVLFPGSTQVQLSCLIMADDSADEFVGEEGGTEGLHCSCFPILAMHPWLARLHNNPYVESSREYSVSPASAWFWAWYATIQHNTITVLPSQHWYSKSWQICQ